MITIRKLAEDLHVTSSNLRKHCLKWGIPMHKRPRLTDSGLQEMLCLDDACEATVRANYHVPRWDETVPDYAVERRVDLATRKTPLSPGILEEFN